MAPKAAFGELDRVRKALKLARKTRDRAPKADHEARSRAEEKVAALEKRWDELYAQLGRRTASKLEAAQTDHASAADLARRGLAMVQTALSRMEAANRDTVAAAMEHLSGAAGSSGSPASSEPAADSSESPAAASIPLGLSPGTSACPTISLACQRSRPRPKAPPPASQSRNS